MPALHGLPLLAGDARWEAVEVDDAEYRRWVREATGLLPVR